MVLKTGKFGVNNGRTVRIRSRSGRPHAKRSEGLLIQTTVSNSFREGKEDEGESITYSLGKQNRWLLPEIIKTNSVEFEKEQPGEVILVERFTNEGNAKSHRPDCFSVFNSTNSTTRKSKRRLARAKDLLSDTESMKTRYEVAYPHPAGSWQNEREWSTKRQAAHLGSRKKNTFVNWTIEEDFYNEISDPDSFYQFEEDDFNDQSYSSDMERSLTFDLGLFIKDFSQKKKKSLNNKSLPLRMKDTEGCKETKLRKGEVIYIESGDEMHDAHQEFLAQIHETGISQDPYNGHLWSGQRGRGHGRGRGRGGRGRGRVGYRANRYEAHHQETLPHADLSAESVEPLSAPFEPSSSDNEWVCLILDNQETTPVALAEKWGEKYKEAACFPRTFILNVTPQTSQFNGAELFVLCRPVEDCLEPDKSKVKASVGTLVISSDETAHELVLAEFASWIQMKSAKEEISSLEDVVNIAKNCFQLNVTDKLDCSEPRKFRLSLEVFTELFGWKSEAFSLKMARQEAKQFLKKKMTHDLSENSPALATMATADHQLQTECGICFLLLHCKDTCTTSSYTFLNACGHKFCDDCWRAHLKTQIQLGHTDLRCPGHECAVSVDDVMLMSLLPSLYSRHLTKRLDAFLEMDPEWKWCPADQCKLVVKATTLQNPTVTCDEHISSVQPVPVVCVCSSMWCFKCQEDAHWPATCKEARAFRETTKGYAKMVANSQAASLITSVQVKNCPFCHYPIEKGPGCNHMQCGLCYEEFCWHCLGKWLWDPAHVCEEKVVQREVELPASTKHLRSYEHFAVTSRIARSSNLMHNVQKKLNKLEKGLQLYAKLSPRVKKEKGWSGRAKQDLNHLCEDNIVHELREMFSFKFQALLALEGLAMVLSFRKDSPNKGLVLAFERLSFIVERMTDILQDVDKKIKCYSKDDLQRFRHLVKCGKECFFIIHKSKK